MARTGRPRRAGMLATVTIGVRVTREEKELLQRAAGFEPLASFIRRHALEAARKADRSR